MRKPTLAWTRGLERGIELALAPGHFVSYRGGSSFVSELESVQEQLAKLTSTNPSQAVALYETFLAGCYEKAEEIDDSSGRFGQFVAELHCAWIRARQAARAAPEDTVRRLLAWMEDDPYGFCHDLEKDAAQALDKAGAAAFVRQVRERFAAAAAAKPGPDPSSRRDRDYARRRWGAVLRTLYLERKNATAYLDLAEETGVSAEDCRALAKLLAARGKAEEALSWVERGLERSRKQMHATAALDLSRLKRDLLTKLGRGREAREDAWAEYRRYPSWYCYEDLMRHVPRTQRSVWHRKAIAAAEGSDLSAHIELLLATNEMERLAKLVRRSRNEALAKVSDYFTEPAARKLEKAHPGLAARLWCAQGTRVVEAGKSRHYHAALSSFERGRRCFEKAGRAAEWRRIVKRVRTAHRRRTGFMSGFEEIVAGMRADEKPSFLDRAKARWSARWPDHATEEEPS